MTFYGYSQRLQKAAVVEVTSFFQVLLRGGYFGGQHRQQFFQPCSEPRRCLITLGISGCLGFEGFKPGRQLRGAQQA